MKYYLSMSPHQARLYFTAEFGIRGGNRILRGLKPFAADDNYESYPSIHRDGFWILFDSSLFQASRRHTKRDAVSLMRRAAEMVAHAEGRLGQRLKGSGGTMRVERR
tara:strand:+ start:221 stop:541 length:321 start_codon:yes stop_codon:yes gene_type:complete